MKTVECLREMEVMEIVGCGRWPDQCPEELRIHISACAICKDVLDVALAFHEDRETALRDAQIPSAGLVWWRAELRARQEAVRRVSRPITLVEVFGAAAGAGIGIALLSRAWPWLKPFLSLPDFATFSYLQWSVVACFAVAIFVIAPLAMYLALSDD